MWPSVFQEAEKEEINDRQPCHHDIFLSLNRIIFVPTIYTGQARLKKTQILQGRPASGLPNTLNHKADKAPGG